MGWPLVQIFILRLVDHFWWLLGIAFMVEPWLDAHVERYHDWADRYVSRQARARLAWTVSIACLFIGSTWAFSDEYWQDQGDLAALHSTQIALTKQKQRADDLDRDINDKGGYKDKLIGLQSSAPKHEAPSRRSYFREHLGKFYTETSMILMKDSIEPDNTHLQQDVAAARKLTTSTATWICQNMGEAAATKYVGDAVNAISDIKLSGDRGEGGLVDMLTRFRSSLSDLMNQATWDPVGRPKPPPGGCTANGALSTLP